MRSTNPMSERLVSIRRKRSSAGSSRRRDRRPRRSAWYFPSTEGSSLMRLYSKRAVATRSRLSSLCTRSSNALEDAPREIRPGMHEIRNAGDDLEDLELRQVAPAPVEEVHREEQRVREDAVAHPRRRQGLALGPLELVRRQALYRGSRAGQRCATTAPSPSRSALPA